MTVEKLTRRERDVLEGLADDLSNQEIARRLTLALSSVKWYAGQVYGKLGVSTRQEAVQRARALGLLPAGGANGPEPGLHPPANLPADLMPVIGRAAELETVVGLLRDPAHRLITLAGPGGVGKTRLATLAAETALARLGAHFQDGAFFVPLAGLEQSSGIGRAVALAILDFACQGGEEDEEEQLFNYLRGRRLLLVLDNFEQLIDAAGVETVMKMVRAAPGLKAVVTSRTQLGMPGETVVTLAGLSVPAEPAGWDGEAGAYGSLALFEACARRLDPAFRLTPANAAGVGRVCRLVDGLPLGIELAAAWIGVLQPDEIADEIEKSPDFLAAGQAALPERQRSYRAVFETSWRLLDEAERGAIQALAIFRAGFTPGVAGQAAGVGLPALRGLVSKSWVQPESGGRFQIHQLLRQYACETVRRDEAAWQAANDRHAAYFCGLLQRLEPDWFGPEQRETYRRVAEEIQDIEGAWRWAVQRGRSDLLEQAITSLGRYYRWSGFWQTGESVFGELAGQRMGGQRLQVMALAWQACLTSDPVEAVRRGEECVELLARPELAGEDLGSVRAFVLQNLAEQCEYEQPDRSERLLQEALALSRASGDRASEGNALYLLANHAWRVGQYERGEELAHAAIGRDRQLGHRRGLADALTTLALIVKHQNQADEAEQMQREALAIYEELGLGREAMVMCSDLAHTLIWQGRFEESQELAREGMARQQAFGDLRLLALAYGSQADAAVHLGQAGQAAAWAEQSIELARQANEPMTEAFSLMTHGMARLAEGECNGAQGDLERAAEIFTRIRQNIGGSAVACLAYAALGLGRAEEARGHLCAALASASRIRTHYPVILALPAAARLAAEEGRLERAAELDALGRRFRYVTNSPLMHDLAGGEVARRTEALGEEGLQKIRERMAAAELWAEVERLREEVCAVLLR